MTIDYYPPTPNAWCPDCGQGHHCPAKVVKRPYETPMSPWVWPTTGPAWWCSSCRVTHYGTVGCPYGSSSVSGGTTQP